MSLWVTGPLWDGIGWFVAELVTIKSNWYAYGL